MTTTGVATHPREKRTCRAQDIMVARRGDFSIYEREGRWSGAFAGSGRAPSADEVRCKAWLAFRDAPLPDKVELQPVLVSFALQQQ
jgi:hypothetical protein